MSHKLFTVRELNCLSSAQLIPCCLPLASNEIFRVLYIMVFDKSVNSGENLPCKKILSLCWSSYCDASAWGKRCHSCNIKVQTLLKMVRLLSKYEADISDNQYSC